MIAYSYTMVLKWFSNGFQRIPWYYIVYAQKNLDMCPKKGESPLCIYKKQSRYPKSWYYYGRCPKNMVLPWYMFKNMV